MSIGQKCLILFGMLWLHIFDDYVLQHLGALNMLKQKIWWKSNAPHKMYNNDYKVALVAHSFSWTITMMLPCLINCFLHESISNYINVAMLFVINIVMHYIIDDIKANDFSINLVTDQIVHVFQVVVTWIIYFII